MDSMKTGAFIKVLRREKGLTQEQLAEIFSVSRRTVSRWETRQQPAGFGPSDGDGRFFQGGSAGIIERRKTGGQNGKRIGRDRFESGGLQQ